MNFLRLALAIGPAKVSSRLLGLTSPGVVARLLCLAFLLMLAAATPVSCGCSTGNTSGRILAATVQSVDSAMQGWGTFVALGHATPDQETAVRSAYAKYQAAEQAAETAYVASAKLGDASIWLRACDALKASQGALLALVNQFTQGKP